MTSVLKVTTLQNLNSSTIITQTNATTITLGISGQNIVIPSGVTFNTASATVTLPSTISATTINATTINVTTVVLAAGAVGTPSLTTSGDTNTGIFFPSADTIAFTEGGTEAMRIDDAGNVGIGKVPSTNRTLELYRTAESNIILQNSTTGTGGTDGFLLEASGSDALIALYEAGNLRMFTSGTERMRIDSGGDLLVQKTSIGTGNAAPNSFDALYSFDSATVNIATGVTGSVKYSQSANAAGSALVIINAYNQSQGNDNRGVVLLINFRNPAWPGGTVINTISTAFADSGQNGAITDMTFAIDAANSELDITPTMRGGSGTAVVNVRFIAM